LDSITRLDKISNLHGLVMIYWMLWSGWAR